jgi:hypothetical protein
MFVQKYHESKAKRKLLFFVTFLSGPLKINSLHAISQSNEEQFGQKTRKFLAKNLDHKGNVLAQDSEGSAFLQSTVVLHVEHFIAGGARQQSTVGHEKAIFFINTEMA